MIRERLNPANLYEWAIAYGGLGLLATLTALSPLPAADQVTAAGFLLLLSFAVKRLGFRAVPEVTHSLGSTVDMTALLILGLPLAGWVACLSTLASGAVSRFRPTRTAQPPPASFMFNPGLKALLTLQCGWLFISLGGRFGPDELQPPLLARGIIVFAAWVLTDHAGWSLLLLLRGGAGDMAKWLRDVAASSVWVEFVPLPLSLLVAVIFGRLGTSAFLLAAAAMLGLAIVVSRLAETSLGLRMRVAELTALNRMGEEILKARLDPDRLCELIYEQASRIVDTSTFQLGLFDGDDYVLKVWIRHGSRQEPITFPGAANEGIIGWMRESRHSLLVHDFAGEAARLPAAPSYISADPPLSGIFVPLLAEGTAIGALAIQSFENHAFNGDDERLLANIANQAAAAILNSWLQAEAEEKRRLEQELGLARQIQASLLPTGAPVIPGYRLAATWQSARQVSGDFYDHFQLPGGRWGILIGDVSGKGVPAALFMALARSLIRSGVMGAQSPAAGLLRANQWILKDSTSGLFVTVYYAVLDAQSGTITCVSCGHNPALLVSRSAGTERWISPRGIALGMFEEIHLEEEVVELPRGGSFVMYTDGVTEARGAGDEMFGRERLRQETVRRTCEPVDALVDGISRAVTDFAGGAPQADDITVLALRRE